MPRPLAELQAALALCVATDPAREANARARSGAAARLARSLPFVHRTAKPGEGGWLSALASRKICPARSCTQMERDAGYPETVCLNLGAGAYPNGLVALILHPQPPISLSGTFTPFDTGGLESQKMVANDGGPLEAADTFHAWLGEMAEIQPFSAHYLAAHLAQVDAYLHVEGDPDFPTVHRVRSVDRPRLGWTIEAQVHEPVPLAGCLNDILLATHMLWEDLSDEDTSVAHYPSAVEGDCDESTFFPFIAQWVRRYVETQ